ncbi:hypothetical protein [Pseudomonas chlororaphis]|uniref:Uncharacterized protein n=1 Tax=Pseudomonas chlororaphis O6 TaxID=1037915 RepID=A0AB33WSJ4_9PSED|nr:hypothetical protein [Pseudomonas chlororaphis]EIM16138.1 hypothetical protein PchlO6_1219 [Pseudomonas chlororaphis O6]
MSRKLMDVANEALDDLQCLKEAFTDAKVMFRAVLKLIPEGDVARELARIGAAHCDEWETNTEAWAGKMLKDLEAIDLGASQ